MRQDKKTRIPPTTFPQGQDAMSSMVEKKVTKSKKRARSEQDDAPATETVTGTETETVTGSGSGSGTGIHSTNPLNSEIPITRAKLAAPRAIPILDDDKYPFSDPGTKEACYYTICERYFHDPVLGPDRLRKLLMFRRKSNGLSLRLLEFAVLHFGRVRNDETSRADGTIQAIFTNYQQTLEVYGKRRFDPCCRGRRENQFLFTWRRNGPIPEFARKDKKRPGKFLLPYVHVPEVSGDSPPSSCLSSPSSSKTSNTNTLPSVDETLKSSPSEVDINDSNGGDPSMIVTALRQLNFFRWALDWKIVDYVLEYRNDIRLAMSQHQQGEGECVTSSVLGTDEEMESTSTLTGITSQNNQTNQTSQSQTQKGKHYAVAKPLSPPVPKRRFLANTSIDQPKLRPMMGNSAGSSLGIAIKLKERPAKPEKQAFLVTPQSNVRVIVPDL